MSLIVYLLDFKLPLTLTCSFLDLASFKFSDFAIRINGKLKVHEHMTMSGQIHYLGSILSKGGRLVAN